MELKKIVVGDNEYIFINTYRNTRSGFAHDTVLMKNGREIGSHSCHYLNRTWEQYTYQTVMGSLVWNLIDEQAKEFIGEVRAVIPSHRITKAHRADLMEEFNARLDIRELHAVKEALKY